MGTVWSYWGTGCSSIYSGYRSSGLLASGFDKWSSLQRIMYIVWNMLPFIQCGMIVTVQLFVCVL